MTREPSSHASCIETAGREFRPDIGRRAFRFGQPAIKSSQRPEPMSRQSLFRFDLAATLPGRDRSAGKPVYITSTTPDVRTDRPPRSWSRGQRQAVPGFACLCHTGPFRLALPARVHVIAIPGLTGFDPGRLRPVAPRSRAPPAPREFFTLLAGSPCNYLY